MIGNRSRLHDKNHKHDTSGMQICNIGKIMFGKGSMADFFSDITKLTQQCIFLGMVSLHTAFYW